MTRSQAYNPEKKDIQVISWDPCSFELCPTPPKIVSSNENDLLEINSEATESSSHAKTDFHHLQVTLSYEIRRLPLTIRRFASVRVFYRPP